MKIISVLPSSSATLYSASLNALPTNYYMTAGNKTASTTYYKLNGTSMATPVVSGAAALLLQKTPSLTPDQIKARIMKTAYKTFPQYSTATDPTTGITYTSQYDIFTVGAGYLDIQNAMQNTDLATATVGSANSPKAGVDGSGNVYIVGGTSVVWGNSTTWGNSIVWGTSVVWGKNAAGESVLWGASVVWGTTATQASSVLWGAAANTACSVVWGVTTQTQANSIATVGEQ